MSAASLHAKRWRKFSVSKGRVPGKYQKCAFYRMASRNCSCWVQKTPLKMTKSCLKFTPLEFGLPKGLCCFKLVVNLFCFLIFEGSALDHKLVYVGNFWKSQSLGEGAAEASESQHRHRPGREQGWPRWEEARWARGESSGGWMRILAEFDSFWPREIAHPLSHLPTVAHLLNGSVVPMPFINRPVASTPLIQQCNDWFSSLIWWMFWHLYLIKMSFSLTHVFVLVQKDAKTYAEDTGLLFMETSAKTAINVNELFLAIGEYSALVL